MLTPAERQEFLTLSRPTSYRRGEVLFREDDVTTHAILIDRGSVKIVRRRPDGADLILAVRGANDLIGEMAAIDGSPRSASAVAVGQVDAYVIEAQTFESFVRSHDNVGWMLIRSMAERQRDADQRRLDQVSASVAHRVAVELLDMADRDVALEPDGFVLSQTELAETVGATREAVSKALGELRRRGAIETSRRRMKILDRAKLVF